MNEGIIIPELDMAAGLRNVGGKPEIYNKVLKCFANEIHNTVSQFPYLVEIEDPLFYIKLHGIKSNCSIIGDSESIGYIEKIETSYIGCEDEELSELVKAFVDHMNDRAKVIEEYLIKVDFEKKNDIGEKQQCNIPGIPRGMAAVLKESLLDMELSEVEKRLEIIKQSSYDAMIEVYIRKIEEAVNRLDFQEACKLLDYVTEKI